MAPYQQSAVKAYLTNFGASTLPPAAQWNATGRGVRPHTNMRALTAECFFSD